MDNITASLSRITGELPAHVQLVVVTKGRTPAQISRVVGAGIKELGENRVVEAEQKRHHFEDYDVRWHMVGHLQSNKVKKAVEIFDMIQSVDSTKIAEVINHRCETIRRKMDVLIQVNMGDEPQKYGFPLQDAVDTVREISHLSALRVRGLMGITPRLDPQARRPYFHRLRECFTKAQFYMDKAQFSILSMGMTEDYRIAIEEGSTMVRIGRAIFE